MKVVWKPNNSVFKKRKGKVALFFDSIFLKFKKFVIIGFIFVPAILIGLFFLIRYLSSDKFYTKNINFYGATLTRQEDIDAIKQEFLGKNIFVIRTSSLEERMKEKGTYVSEVYVEKILPDTLEVHIEEKKPEVIYINFSNAYLLTADSEVIDIISQEQGLELREEETAILKGFGDPNSEFVIDRIMSEQENLEEDEAKIEEFKAAITQEEKDRVLNDIRGEIRAKIEQVYALHLDNISKSRFWHLPQTFVYESKRYSLEDEVDSKKIEFFLVVVDFIEEMGQFEVQRYQWDSDFKLTVHFMNGKTFLFSIKRDINLQKEDMLLVLNELKTQGKDYKSIDVGAEKVVVER